VPLILIVVIQSQVFTDGQASSASAESTCSTPSRPEVPRLVRTPVYVPDLVSLRFSMGNPAVESVEGVMYLHKQANMSGSPSFVRLSMASRSPRPQASPLASGPHILPQRSSPDSAPPSGKAEILDTQPVHAGQQRATTGSEQDCVDDTACSVCDHLRRFSHYFDV